MRTRRAFLRSSLGVVTGTFCYACSMRRAAAQRFPRGPRREVSIAGNRVRTIDIHCHCQVPEVIDAVRGTPLEKIVAAQRPDNQGFPVGAERISDMDHDGIDIEALSINPFWYR